MVPPVRCVETSNITTAKTVRKWQLPSTGHHSFLKMMFENTNPTVS